ncbi:nuclear transport factor 2 family protein [Rhizobium sp. ZW T2_16]|uniref:nuclear transport factor 2 family protein n=1 Tax=Rhizobium sp. ZW T2_16 TaxID=3378083 RepID=UPI000F95982E
MPNADAIVDAFYRAYNDHDALAAVRLYAEDGRHDEIAFGAARQGYEELRKGLEGFFAMMPDVCWRERERIRSADHVAILYEMTGTFLPRPKEGASLPSARSVTLEGLHMLEIRDGRITVSQDYWDKAEFLAQIA